jgi:hypothetical protein
MWVGSAYWWERLRDVKRRGKGGIETGTAEQGGGALAAHALREAFQTTPESSSKWIDALRGTRKPRYGHQGQGSIEMSDTTLGRHHGGDQ